MKAKRWILVLCAFALVATIPMQASGFGLVTGDQLVKWMRAHTRVTAGLNKSLPSALSDIEDLVSSLEKDTPFSCIYIGYIRGVSEALHLLGNSTVPPKGVTAEQSVAVVTRYLEAHPEEWHKAGFMLVTSALVEAFSKKDAK